MCRRFSIAHWAGVFMVGLLIASMTGVHAAEIKVFTARAGATVLEKIGPEFERTTGHKINVIYDPVIGGSLRQIRAGEPFDVLILGSPVIDALVREGKILAETRINLMRSGVGLGVRAGTPKPDISSVEGIKRTLLAAKSIGYVRAVNRVEELVEQLGLADAIRSKVTIPDSDIVSELVAKGELELGIVLITQILTSTLR